MQWLGLPFAYIGPETILPATSVLAAIGGLLLTFGKTITRPIVGCVLALFGKKSPAQIDKASEQPIAATPNEQ